MSSLAKGLSSPGLAIGRKMARSMSETEEAYAVLGMIVVLLTGGLIVTLHALSLATRWL